MRYTSPDENANPRLLAPQTEYCTQQCFGKIDIKMDP